MQAKLSWVEQYLNHLGTEKRYSMHTLKAVAADLQRCACIQPVIVSQANQVTAKQALSKKAQIENTSAQEALHDKNPQVESLSEQAAAEQITNAQWQSVTPEHLRTQLLRMRAQGLAPTSLARCASSWRGFFKWAIQRGYLSVNPALSLKLPKRPRMLPKALTVDQAQALFKPIIEQPGEQTNSKLKVERNVRDQCLVEVLYCTGLRISEAVGLQLVPFNQALVPGQLGGWLNISDRKLIIFGKGGKNRLLDLNQAAWIAIERWLDLRNKWLSASSRCGTITEKLFINEKGRPMTVGMAQYAVASYAKRHNCPVPVHPHMLRHSFASHILQSSADLRGVQELMGHASIASTQIYTALDFQHLAAVYDKAHPRAKK